MPLLIKGIVASNVRAWTESGDIGSFWFKPQSLLSVPFQGLIDHARDVEALKEKMRTKATSRPMAMVQRFCSATTPTEFLVWALSPNSSLPLPEVRPALRRLLVASLGDAARGYPFLVAEDEKIGGSQRPAPVRRAVEEFRSGVYVDVFGTLIHHDGSPNLRLAQVVKDLMNRVPPVPVYVVSDSQVEEVERALAFLEKLPTIIPKDRLERCELECLIDNCEPGPQGLQARRYFSPERAVEFAARLLDSELPLTTTKP